MMIHLQLNPLMYSRWQLAFLLVLKKGILFKLQQVMDKEVHPTVHLPIQIGGFQLIMKTIDL